MEYNTGTRVIAPVGENARILCNNRHGHRAGDHDFAIREFGTNPGIDAGCIADFKGHLGIDLRWGYKNQRGSKAVEVNLNATQLTRQFFG